MAYDEKLAERVRVLLHERGEPEERKMFGGLCFMMRGHMCMGIVGDELMLRTGPDGYESAVKRKHARPMDFTGRPMTTMIYVSPQGLKTSKALSSWVDLAIRFNDTLPPKKPKAKKTKPKPRRARA